MMKTLLSTLILFLSLNASAFSISSEIAELNKTYGRSQDYPILVLDKADLNAYIKSLKIDKSLNQGEQERELIKALMMYIYSRFNYKMNPADATELISYATEPVRGASAMPFFVDNIHHKMRLCLVLPTDVEPDHIKEIKTIIGADDQPQLFKNFDIQKAATLMTSEELQLFTIYHELSHCLDQKYLPEMYEAETDPWAVHRAESFAETNALFMIAQRKGLNNLAYPRSLLRTAYSKIYGPFLANTEGSPFTNIVVKSAGSSYFLSIPMMKAQEVISNENAKIQAMTLAQTIALSQQVVENFGLTKFGSEALRAYISEGSEKTLERYQRLASKNSKMFGKAYEELLVVDSWMKSLDERIQIWPRTTP
ncbi:hypothetical protein [Bdellovibrio sp. HCB337]|uniref:hypothetical protein n=1 Tax=Bdellovibrio sp. HCB337 TaxID=3394358 RepID=UPI0039A4B089